MIQLRTKPLPKISCLLVTAAGRFHHVQRSVKCYLNQTYSNKELIVVNEGPVEYQSKMDEWFELIGRLDIRPIWLSGKYTLGALRNISMAMANGEYFCQWDDDDFCMPYRLAAQYSKLSNTPNAKICYLSDQLHFYFPTGELYWDNWKKYHSGNVLSHSLIPGTILSERDIGIRYPSFGEKASAGEDSVFSDRLIEKMKDHICLLSGMGYMHMYSFHGTNQVYNAEHHSNISKFRCQNRSDVIRCRNQICEIINHLELPGEVKIMCRDGLVFTHKSRSRHVENI